VLHALQVQGIAFRHLPAGVLDQQRSR